MKQKLQDILRKVRPFGGKRAVSLVMILAMLVTSLPLNAWATTVSLDENGVFTITDDEGNVTTVDESWEETFPYGTFAFSNTEAAVAEGDEVTVTLYRLGGTKGRVSAFVEYNPTVTVIEEGTPTFVYAAGYDDVYLTVENPSPWAKYDPVGKPDIHIEAAGFSPAVDSTRTKDDKTEGRRVVTYGETCYYLPTVPDADGYIWQVQEVMDGEWTDITNSNQNYLIVTNDLIYEAGYDYRCVYTIGEETFCTDSVWSTPYVEEEAEVLPERPASLDVPEEPTYTTIPSYAGEFETYEKVGFWVTFGDGEVQKTITVHTIEDTIIEGEEFGTLTITDHEGGSLYETANKCIVQVLDNEEHEETVLSFDVTETTFDRATGEAVIAVTRTGDVTYPVTVAYTVGTEGDTAVAGTHYATTEGTLYFYGDVATQKITVPLITAAEPDEDGKTLTVVLSDLRGGLEADLASLTEDSLTVTLVNTGTVVGESMNLATLLTNGDGVEMSDVGEAEPVSAPQDAVIGDAQGQTGEELTAEIVWNDPKLRTYQYPITLWFSRPGTTASYRANYWADWENIVNGEEKDISSTAGYGNRSSWEYSIGYESDDVPKGATMSFVNEGGYLRLKSNAMAIAELAIDNGEVLFDRLEMEVYNRFYAIGTHEKDRAVVMTPVAYAQTYSYDKDHILNGSGVDDNDWQWNSTYTFDKSGKKGTQYIQHNVRTGSVTLDWKDKKRVTHVTNGDSLHITMLNVPVLWGKTLVNGEATSYDHYVMDDTANATQIHELQFGQLRRQKFTNDLGLTIYTANDADVLAQGTDYARLDAYEDVYAENIYDSIKPVITIAKGQGGVDTSGRLYVGSTLQVKLAAFGGYNAPDVGEGYDYSVYLTNKAGDVLVEGVYAGEDEGGNKLYNMTLLWEEMYGAIDKKEYLDDQYTIHVVMDRQQNIIINLAPSMYEIDANGNVGDALPVNKMGTAINYFLQRKGEGDDGFVDIYYAKAEENKSKAYFNRGSGEGLHYYQRKIAGGNYEGLKYSINLENKSITLTNVPTDNLYSIRFDLPAEDKIAFNGRTYNGDDTIYLKTSDLLMADLVFYYYHEAVISVPTTMVTTIDKAYLYLDSNCNGRIDGYIDGNNTFVPAGGADTLITSFPADKITDVDERYAEPVWVTVNGKEQKAQYILKVAYTMNPRKLVPLTEEEGQQTAIVQPNFTTAITEANGLATQTAEQRANRYIQAATTTISNEDVVSSDNKVMFGGEATKLQYVDIPLGGDYEPPFLGYENVTYNEDGTNNFEAMVAAGQDVGYEVYKWMPDYRGNLVHEYDSDTIKNVRPIIIANTVAGTNFPIATADMRLDMVTRQITYDYVDIGEEGKPDTQKDIDNMNGYLGSFVGATIYSLIVRAPNADTGVVEEESVTMGNLKTHPNSEYLQNMQGNNTSGGVDMDESGAEYPEFNSGFSGELGATNLNVNDYMTIIVDGYNVGFSIGVPLGGYHSNGDAGASGLNPSSPTGPQPPLGQRIKENMYSPGTANQSRGEELINALAYLKGKTDKTDDTHLSDIDDSYRAATQESRPAQPATATSEAKPAQEPQYNAKGMGIELSVRLMVLFTWNPLDNGYYFSSMTVTITGNLVFTVQHRFTACPLLYCYVKIGAGLELTTGIGVARSTKRAENGAQRADTGLSGYYMEYSKDNPLVLKKGESVIFRTKYRTFDTTFNGAMMVEVSKDYSKNSSDTNKLFEPLEKVDGRELRTGVISSGGSEPMTITMVEKDGATFHDDKVTNNEGDSSTQYYVRLTAVEDTKLINVFEVTDVRTKVYWTGVTISPSAFLEVGIGVGVELMKVELCVSAGIGFTATVGSFNTVTEKYEGGSFDNFNFTLGLTLRVVAIVFNFDFDLARYIVTYGDIEPGVSTKKGWTHTFKAGGGGYTTSKSTAETPVRPMVQIILPDSAAETQQFFRADDGKNTKAFNATSSEVPFQLSGYGTSMDAFRVAEGLTTRSDYKIVTLGDDNYLLFTISRGTTSTVNDTMLVMSRLQVVTDTNGKDSYGLVNPVNEDSETPYILVDTIQDTVTEALVDDGTGDLSFNAWVEGNAIHVSWISYQQMKNARNIPVLNQDDTAEDKLAYQSAMAARTEVKTAVFDTKTATGFTEATVVSTGSTGYTFLPDGAEGAVFYAEAVPYDPTGLSVANTAYENYLNVVYNGSTAPTTNASGDTIQYDNTEETARAREGIRQYLLLNRTSDNGLYGQGTKLHFQKNGIHSEIALGTGEMLGNMEFTASDTKADTWLLAYTTYQLAYYDHSTGMTITDLSTLTNYTADQLDEVRVQRLYIREVSLSESTVTWGNAKLLRILLDMDNHSEADGRYSGGSRVVTYQDPTFSNLRFLHAKLGNSLENGEGVDIDFPQTRNGHATDSETFLLFDMMGSTYVLPREDMEAILAGTGAELNEGRGPEIYPFFVPETLTTQDGKETNRTDNTHNTATGRMEATIASDAEGNLAAVYTASVEGTGNNGLYITWYDPASSTWGQGKLLAMNHMQVYEDAESYNLTYEEKEKAYLGQHTGNTKYDEYLDTKTSDAEKKHYYGAMDKFTFSDIQLALGKVERNVETGEVDRSTLLIMTKGAMTDLVYLDDETLQVETTPDEDSILTAKRDSTGSVISANTGFYGIVVGAGKQEISHAKMSLASYGFDTGDFIQSYISFTNTGDAAIRGSAENPITITLTADTPKSTEGETSGSIKLATWKIDEHILAGQEVKLMNEGDTAYLLDTPLPLGTQFHLHLQEDKEYIESTGGVPYSFSTEEPLLTIEKKPELLFEKLDITPVRQEGDKTVLKVDAIVSNLGDEIATDVYVQFQYQNDKIVLSDDGVVTEPVYAPVDLTGHNLKISHQKVREMATRHANDDLANGILYLAAEGEGDTAGQLSPNHYRTITGEISVPSSYYYADDPANALNLKVDVFSNHSSTFQNRSTGIVTSDHTDEYQSLNNTRTTDIAQKTWFQMPGKITVTMGNTMRIPVTAQSSRGTTPVLVATEIPDNSITNLDTWEPCLTKLYYDVQSDTVVIMPAKLGSGIIRLTDPQTNSIQDIAFTVYEEGAGINIYNDNQLFTFSEGDWEFQNNIPENVATGITPYRSDLSVAPKAGATVSFKSAAQSITLTFSGSVKIEILDEAGTQVARTYNLNTDKVGGADALKSQTITWRNEEQKTQTIRITTTKDQTSLDTVAEKFSNNEPPVPEADAGAPQIYWSNPFPEEGSLAPDTTVTLTGYVVDDGTLNSLLVNGKVPAGLTEITPNLWSFPFAVDKDDIGNYEIVVTDSNGNTTTETVAVNWFNANGGETWNPPAAPDVLFVDGSGDEITGENNESPYLMKPETAVADGLTVSAGRYDTNVSAFQGLNGTPEDEFTIGGNGIYRMTVTDEDGNSTSVITALTALPPDAVNVLLTRNQFDAHELTYTVSKGSTAPQAVRINGVDMAVDANGNPLPEGSLTIAYNGTYTLFAKFGSKPEESGTDSITIDDIRLTQIGETLPYETTNPWNQEDNNGTLTLDPTTLTGGYYQTDVQQKDGTYIALYEYCLVVTEDGKGLTAEEMTALLADDTQWTAFAEKKTVRDDLTSGFYNLYIRDSAEPDNAERVLRYEGITLVGLKTIVAATATPALYPESTDGTITLTAQGGKGTGAYAFLCTPVSGEYGPETNANLVTLSALYALDDSLWVESATDTYTFTGLDEGWYQIAARKTGLTYPTDGPTGDWDNTVTYAVYVGRRSGDATLATLTTDPSLEGFFQPDVFEYAIEVPNEISHITIDYTLSDPHATLVADMTGRHPLVTGENVFEITVLAEDMTTTLTYTIIVTRDISDFQKYWPMVMDAYNEDVVRGYDWQELSARILRARKGRTFVVDPLSDAFVATENSMEMPGYVLDSLGTVNATLRLKAGDDVVWVLHSEDVSAPEDNRGFNLTASLGEGVIADSAVQAVAGDLWSTQLTLRYTGTTDVVTHLETDLGMSQANKSARLYQRDNAGDLVYLTEATVNAKGIVTWTMPTEIGGTYLIVTETTATK